MIAKILYDRILTVVAKDNKVHKVAMSKQSKESKKTFKKLLTIAKVICYNVKVA